jgi:two-component system, sensor histidine kinase and response regulator
VDEPIIRILIVDDEALHVAALCDTLKNHGYETTGFTSPRAALAALRDTKFELLLADLTMPEMSGIDLLRAARELDPDIVSIIMTGQGTIATAVEAMKVGALDYVLKPFKLSIVLPVLSRALAMRSLCMANAELERRLQQRGAELEAANKELESFSYSVSHDLQAPVRAISGFSNILLEDFSSQMPVEAQVILGKVAGSAGRMGQLIKDLLAFSRLGRQPLSKRTVDMAALVQEVADDLIQREPGRRIELRVAELPDCLGDPSLLKQVFINLLSNALKFTRQREQAKIEVGCRTENGERVYFILDNGVGFDMRYAEKLFGVFQRLHKADEFEGTGVGLSIVGRIIQRHGGRIWADAEVDKGATFHFVLP